MTETVEQLRKLVADESLPVDERKGAAERLLVLQRLAAGDEIADDDPDVLALMAGSADEKWLAELPSFRRALGPRPLVEAREIVRLRRLIQAALRQTVADTVPEADRLAAVRTVLQALGRLAELEVNPEDSTYRRIGAKSAEVLLASARTVDNPKSAWDLW